MFRKALSVLLAVIVFAAVIPVAYAVPYNQVDFNSFYVFGGPSHIVCTNKTCTEPVYCDYEITGLNLNGQSKISIRPYKGSTMLSNSPTNITNTTARLNIIYDTRPSKNNKLSMKASIPSTNTADYAIFSGHIWF